MDTARKIYIIGDIDEASYKEFAERMDEAEEMLEGDDIEIELASHGGDAMMALAYFDRIRQSKSEITIKAYGSIASAATLILAAGDKRYMSKNAWVMVHEDSILSSEDGTKITDLEKQAKIGRQIEEQWNRLMASRSKLSSKRWEELHKDETYLQAEECLAYGLIDKII